MNEANKKTVRVIVESDEDILVAKPYRPKPSIPVKSRSAKKPVDVPDESESTLPRERLPITDLLRSNVDQTMMVPDDHMEENHENGPDRTMWVPNSHFEENRDKSPDRTMMVPDDHFQSEDEDADALEALRNAASESDQTIFVKASPPGTGGLQAKMRELSAEKASAADRTIQIGEDVFGEDGDDKPHSLPRIFQKTFWDALDRKISGWMGRNGIRFLRWTLGIIFIWFGALKPMGLSPAQELVSNTVYWVDPAWFVPFLGYWEVLIGVGLMYRPLIRPAIALLFLQMPGTFMPLVLLPQVCFTRFPVGLTMEGQYIIKNLVLIAAALVVGGTVRDLGKAAKPRA